jgi:hypothetical protein
MGELDTPPISPLYLPEGSIRALMTFGALVLAGVLLVEQLPVPEWFRSILDIMIGFYFGSRSKAA